MTVANIVGVGDAFCVALVLALRNELDYTRALAVANAVGADAVGDPSSQRIWHSGLPRGADRSGSERAVNLTLAATVTLRRAVPADFPEVGGSPAAPTCGTGTSRPTIRTCACRRTRSTAPSMPRCEWRMPRGKWWPQ